MPSSLTVNLPSALVYSTRPRVSVWSTGDLVLKFSGFSWKSDYRHYRLAPKGPAYYRALARKVDLPAFLNTFALQPLFRQEAAVSLLRRRVTHQDSNGILTVSSIALAIRLMLRTRLTLNRLALFRKPWSFGGGHPTPLSLLIPTFAFPCAPEGSRPAFQAACNAPLPMLRIPRLR